MKKSLLLFFLISLCFFLAVPKVHAAFNAEGEVNRMNEQIQGLEDSMNRQNDYISVLEKTNQQLNLIYNPYAIMVGVLAILFTILTIVAIVIIYRQGQEYKNRIKADRDLYKKKIDEFLTAQMKVIKQRDSENLKLSKKADEIINAYQKKLKESSAEQKKEIQKEINRLEVEKFSLTSNRPQTVTPDQMSGMASALGMRKYCKCSSCGYGFYVDTSANLFVQAGTTATCPKCGSVNMV